jgi:outer membrane protein OmpA-like peptidoglycan-associated protein
LTQHAITELPKTPASKTFTYDARRLFADADTAKLKKAQALSDAGRFLEGNPFGAAVVSVSGGMTGNADEVKLLTQARAMVVRDYLVKTFKMDDTRVKTMGLGKREETANDGGTVEISIYPPGSAVGPTKIARTR